MNTDDEMHQHYLREAVQLAHEHMRAGAGGPFGALVVRDGEIIGKGWNRVTSHNDPTAHAEVSAIRAACEKVGDFSLAGSVIYTSCEPCPMCLGAIWWSRIDAIYFASTRDDAARVGFDWPKAARVLEKVREEASEVEEAIEAGDLDQISEEIGDLLFVCTNLGRKLDVDVEAATRAANAKFERRFRYIEGRLYEQGRSPEGASLEEMEELWLEAKAAEKRSAALLVEETGE